MKQTLTNNELAFFAEQISMILHSGISVLEGISIMRDDTPEGEGRSILDSIYESLEMTGDFADSLQKTDAFPDYFLKMTEIGDRSGTLEEVMTSLADYYGRQNYLMKSIREALVYPLVLLGMLLVVLIVLMTKVMPVFQQVFEQLGIEINGLSGAIFKAGSIMQFFSTLLLFLLVAAVLFSLFSIRSEKGRDFLMKIVLLLPVGRKVSELLSASRFTQALGLSLHSGLDMEESFTLASSLSNDPDFLKKSATAQNLLQEGKELSDSLKDAGIITGINARMISIGIRTGAIEEALNQISIACSQEADQTIQTTVDAIEPTLTVILSVLTGMILLSVMLPLLGVMSGIG